jgi:predicted HTH domain antitoxin
MVPMTTEVMSARLPKERVDLIEEIAREEKVDKSTILDRALDHYIREWKLQRAIESYREGTATLPKAAEIAGQSIWEMIDILAKRKIQPQYDIEDLEEDLKVFGRD